MTEQTLAVAPMMGYTDRHFRRLLRCITLRTVLYTEMVTAPAILYGDCQRLLAYDPIEHPIVLQLGGSDPDQLSQCAKIATQLGFEGVNLNVGCPSSRVQRGAFGACLMKTPHVVADCVQAMRESASIPVSVKTRLGVDEQDSYEALCHFVELVAAAGCRLFIIHARKAWLKGLNPKENREIPPLCYERVYQLKRDFPHLSIMINGGIKSLDDCLLHAPYVDGSMIGREVYRHPLCLAQADSFCQGLHKGVGVTPEQVVHAYLPYMKEQLAAGVPLRQLTRHLLSLFHGGWGAKRWRRYLTENSQPGQDGINVMNSALAQLRCR